MRDCLIYTAYVPENLYSRGEHYLKNVKEFFSDSNVFIAVNHGTCERFISDLENLKTHLNLTIFKTSEEHSKIKCEIGGWQMILKYLKDNNIKFECYHFCHTQGITHQPESNFLGCVGDLNRRFLSNRHRYNGLMENPLIGGCTTFGFYDCFSDGMDRFIKLPYKSNGIMGLLDYASFNSEVMDYFLTNVNDNFFKPLTSFGLDRWWIECHLSSICDRLGLYFHVDSFWEQRNQKPLNDEIKNTLFANWIGQDKTLKEKFRDFKIPC